MENAALVGVINSARHLRNQPSGLLDRPSTLDVGPETCIGERPARDHLHAEVVLTVVLTDFVNGNNVRMIEPGSRFGFGVKTLHRGRCGQPPGENHLERDGTIKAYLT